MLGVGSMVIPCSVRGITLHQLISLARQTTDGVELAEKCMQACRRFRLMPALQQ